MVTFDSRFRVDYSHARAKNEAIFKGQRYRITVLTERLVRLEYNIDGQFFDDLTEQVRFRDFPIPEFKVVEDDRRLEITTKYFVLKYAKEKPFEGLNIEVVLLDTDKSWNIRSREVRNFNTSGKGIIGTKPDYQKGLYSTEGFVSFNDSDSLIINNDGFLFVNQKPRMDIYLFMYRRDFGLCLQDYFRLTGFPPLIPRYALGIWWNKSDIYNFQDIEYIIQHFNKHKIPLSILLLDEFWHLKDSRDLTRFKTGYTFNRNLFSDPMHLSTYLHGRGIKLGVTIDPTEGIMPHEDHYEQFATNMGFTERTTIPFNVFDKAFINNYFSLLLAPLKEKGVDFFFLKFQPQDIRMLRAISHYMTMESDSTKEKRSMLMSYNGLVGAHHTPVLYSGETFVDWETLNTIPYYNSMASNKGLSWWSHDIGGYQNGTEEAELYMRYAQLGCFSPIFRLSSKGGKYYKREPWKWDVKTLTIVSDYARLRYRLIPYLYSENYKYHRIGMPLIEPLYYIHPEIYDEPNYKNEYFFGTELLVAPITDRKDLLMNRTVKRIFLPAGVWYDFKTGKKFLGNKRYVTFYKDEDYPVFAKSGSIIPLGNLRDNLNDTSVPEELEIHIFPGKSNIYKLYEDDGESSLYKEGYSITTAIDYNYLQNNHTVIIRPIEGKSGIIPDVRNYKIRFRNTRKADEVIVHLDQDEYPCDSYVDDADFIVEIANVKTTSQLTVNCKGKNIEIDASHIINEDIDLIISDIQIKTNIKEMLAKIMFSDMDISKKRIEIKKLKNVGLEKKFISMFIRLVEYISEF